MKRRSIQILLVLSLVLVFALGACTSANDNPVNEENTQVENNVETNVEDTEAVVEPAGESLVIGLASFQQGNDWNIQVAQGAKAQIEALGWEVVHTNAETDMNAMVTALEGFLSQGVDGVVIAGGAAPSFEAIIADLNAAGIPVTTLDITSENAATNIYPDNYMTTELLGVFAVNYMDAKPGVYAHLTIPDFGWKTVDIRDKVADLVFEIEGWEFTGILDSGLADAVNQSMTATRSALLANPDLDLVYSSWGMPAVGAARAIREAGMQDEVFVVCTDADRIVLAEMMEDDSPIKGVIGQRPYDMGVMAVNFIADAVAGVELPTVSFAPFYFVTDYPDMVPPGVEVLSPEEAWEILYPDVELGSVN